MNSSIPQPSTSTTPQPQDSNRGGTDTGPRNLARDRQNPDILVPPSTDSGTLPNLRFSFSDAHNRLEKGGWAREVTIRELPIATTLAGVNMRLNPGDESGVRELHWHKEAEWAYMLNGQARLTAIDAQGGTFIGDVAEGDLWYFPAGLPHSIQAHEGGCEFLLVFDDGNFSENSTFLLTDWLAHTPKDVLAKNFGVDPALLAHLPTRERYIFPASAPGPVPVVQHPAAESFTYPMLAQSPKSVSGGQVRIVDSGNFPIAQTIAAALVEVEPGALRELHWHPNADEWQYYLEGQGRMTVFASGGKARTFDYQAGDVGYVPFAMGHYVENTGTTTLRFLEMFKSDRFADLSLSQWLALVPPELVKAHLNVTDEFIAQLPHEKPIIVANQPKLTNPS